MALARLSTIASFWIRPLDERVDETAVFPCLSDQISRHNLHRQHLKYIYLSLEAPSLAAPTITWASQQDWSLPNLVSFRLKLSCDALSDETFAHLQQLIDHFRDLPKLQALCIDGDYKRDEMHHSWESILDISEVLASASINQLWIKGFRLVLNRSAATSLKKLALIFCELTRESFVNLLLQNNGR